MKRTVKTARFGRTSTGPYVQGICVPAGRGLIFTAGIIARDAEGAILAPFDVRVQTREVIENLKALLADGGSGLEDVVKLTIYLRDVEGDLSAVREVRDEYWPDDPPAATAVQVSRLMTDAVRIEIEAVAMLPEERRPGGEC